MDRRVRGAIQWTIVLSLILLANVATSFAQGQGNGIFLGVVSDADGIIPGATVTATNTATGLVRSVTTTDVGDFRLLSMPPGRYTLKVEMDGFKQITMNDVVLLSGEERNLGKLVLELGTLSESVLVTTFVTPVQTTTSQLQRTVTSDQITMIQVKGRDIFGMMKILPGVVDTTFSRDFTTTTAGRGISINGGNSLNKNTTIDGVPVGEEGGDGTTIVTPNIDAIGEVTVITNGYRAENGRQSSGLVSIVTKSGTNEFRGTAWYNARRDDWNANDYFRQKQGAAKPFFEVNISGYSIGGPVIIPKLLDSRKDEKKVYFFLSNEFITNVRPTDIVRTNLPTALERAGDFSQTRNPNGSIQQIIDPRTGRQFPGNMIPADRISPMGRSMLNLLPMPNGITNLAAGQEWTSNDAQELTPSHKRIGFVSRVDAVLSSASRVSVRTLYDNDTIIDYNRVAPGVGSVTNVKPGTLVTAGFSKVISPTMVNEMTGGWQMKHFGFKIGTGSLNASDYTSMYRQNVGLDPPRLEPFGAYGDPHLGPVQLDEYPYLPNMLYNGGTRTNLAACSTSGCPSGYRPSGGSGPLPRWNENSRWTFQNDLSWTKGRHNYKFGFFTERDVKTEPGSNDYAGVYNFGHSADNPLSTGNGYANALLGVFTTYTELDNRVDAEVAHWQTDAYAQDSWKITPRMTLDYGLRIAHHGAIYETRDQNSGFDPSLWKGSNAPTLYEPYCLTPVSGNQACATANRRAINPITGEIVSQAYAGNTVPGSGSITNGMFAGGVPGMDPGWYYQMPAISWAPRVGMAWDVFGDGKTALRAATGIFYNFINRSQYIWTGGPLISSSRIIRNAEIADIAAFGAAGTQFADSPQTGNLPDGYQIPLYGQSLKPQKLEPEKNYQANIAFQREIGFQTTAEIAWVGNFGRHFWRIKNGNNIPINAYANPANLFNGEAINANFLRRDYPGMGPIRYLTTDEEILNYNSMQISVQRRLNRGLQMGLSYTLSKAEGVQGWDFATEELGGEQAIRERYYGPPSVSQNQDRRHVMVVNYSYAIPTPNIKFLDRLLANWEASGVTQFTTGNAIDPICNTNLAGIANTDPSLSGVPVRCELTGEPIFDGFPVASGIPEEDQMHFNPAAFKRPVPAGGVGSFGNAPTGVLRHPSWQNWDFTLARRIRIAGRSNLRVQFQVYNLFNQVQFITLNANYLFGTTGNSSPDTGKYTATTNPRNVGITLRLDF
jgi:hypothetical protein